MHHHAHDLFLLSQSAHVRPAPDVLEAVNPAARPGAGVQTPVVHGERVSLGVVPELAAVGPSLAIVTIHGPAVVAAGVQHALVNRRGLDALALGGAAAGPLL